jgi:hypothetical protein
MCFTLSGRTIASLGGRNPINATEEESQPVCRVLIVVTYGRSVPQTLGVCRLLADFMRTESGRSPVADGSDFAVSGRSRSSCWINLAERRNFSPLRPVIRAVL